MCPAVTTPSDGTADAAPGSRSPHYAASSTRDSRNPSTATPSPRQHSPPPADDIAYSGTDFASGRTSATPACRSRCIDGGSTARNSRRTPCPRRFHSTACCKSRTDGNAPPCCNTRDSSPCGNSTSSDSPSRRTSCTRNSTHTRTGSDSPRLCSANTPCGTIGRTGYTNRSRPRSLAATPVTTHTPRTPCSSSTANHNASLALSSHSGSHSRCGNTHHSRHRTACGRGRQTIHSSDTRRSLSCCCIAAEFALSRSGTRSRSTARAAANTPPTCSHSSCTSRCNAPSSTPPCSPASRSCSPRVARSVSSSSPSPRRSSPRTRSRASPSTRCSSTIRPSRRTSLSTSTPRRPSRCTGMRCDTSARSPRAPAARSRTPCASRATPSPPNTRSSPSESRRSSSARTPHLSGERRSPSGRSSSTHPTPPSSACDDNTGIGTTRPLPHSPHRSPRFRPPQIHCPRDDDPPSSSSSPRTPCVQTHHTHCTSHTPCSPPHSSSSDTRCRIDPPRSSRCTPRNTARARHIARAPPNDHRTTPLSHTHDTSCT